MPMNTRRRRPPTKPRRDLLRPKKSAPRAPFNTAAFYAMLPAKPTSNNPDDAKAYHLKIYALLERDAMLLPGSASKLKRHERANLQRLERRWKKRAAGEDARWNVVGAKAGRAYRELEQQYRKPPHPEFADH